MEHIKSVLRGNCIAMNHNKSKINNQTLHLRELENKEQAKTKVNRRKENMKIRTEINEIQIKKNRTMKLTAGFQKTDKPTARLKNLKRDNNVRKRMCVYMYITYIYIHI